MNVQQKERAVSTVKGGFLSLVKGSAFGFVSYILSGDGGISVSFGLFIIYLEMFVLKGRDKCQKEVNK